ncbi:MAG TPA: HDOD domain-containing protein [Kofleriaceae bacterium]|nr:HDOD domain-containing protein [Kofleriaceae bacterium]
MTTTIPRELDERLIALIQAGRVKIPAYPAIAMRVGQLLKRPDYTMGELSGLIASDQAMSAAVMRTANSARMRTSTLQSLSDALQRIGSNELVRLAFAIGLGQTACQDGVLLDLRRAVWRQSVWSAFLCRELATRWSLDPEPAFLCGLLHDFGRVVALSCLEEIISGSGAGIKLSPARVCQVVEAYHVEIGMVMAEKWSLPATVADVIREHHYVPARPGRDHVDLVRATDQVVALMESSLVVERGDLDAMGSFTGDERDYLAELLPALPGLVEGLDPQAGAALPRISQYMRIQIEATDPESAADVLHHADVEATCRVFGDDNRCNVIGIGPRRLQLLSIRPYAPQTVLQVTLDGEEGPFRMWCTLTSIRQQMRRHGQRYVLEVKPFALTATAKLGWAQLLASRADAPLAPSSG